MPYPSTLRRSSSDPLQASDARHTARFDPLFIPYRDQLADAKTLLTFDSKTKSLVLFHYPCYDDGKRVPPEELLSYWETHDMQTPVCFCALKTGEEKMTLLFIPRFPFGEHFGHPCLTCSEGLCSAFVDITWLYNDNKNLPCKKYPLLPVVRRRIIPPRYASPMPTTPKRRREGSSAAGRILEASARSSSIVGPTPSPTGSKRPTSASPAAHRIPKAPQNSPVKSERSEGGHPPYVGDDAIYTQSTPKPFPMDIPPTPTAAMLRGMYGGDLAGIFGTGDYGSDPAFVNGLLRLYSPGLLNRVNHQDAFPEEYAVELLLKTMDSKSPGITVLELTRILARCMRCSRVTLHALLPTHKCPDDDDDDDDDIEVVSVSTKARADDGAVKVETIDKGSDGSTQGTEATAGSDSADGSEEDQLAPPKKKTRLSGPVPHRTDWAWHAAQAKQAASRRTVGGSGVASSSRSAGGSRVASSSRSAGGSRVASSSRSSGGSGVASSSRSAGASRGGAGRAAPPAIVKADSKGKSMAGGCKESPIDVDGLA
ncbi:hypothetical protein FA95DRAFT_1602411 [Auriscalpium vulgare]|uniref:Uncharacterized protein n=1 Tax=Auriscalpium vulgare TaxID=40419 RepID=A0ACB8S635_9AGAM|nr:hypothetical protein FA95DRAFT_1602411 [Auriscalpium vulgare]